MSPICRTPLFPYLTFESAQNGSGKSTLLKCVAARMVPIPEFIDIWFLDKEADPSDRTAVESVIDTVRNEKERLEAMEEEIMSTVGPDDPRRASPPLLLSLCLLLSLSLFGTLLFEDQTIELTYGHRYGLIAQVTHFSHMSHPAFPISHLLIVFFEFCPPRQFLPYVAPHFSHISPFNRFF